MPQSLALDPQRHPMCSSDKSVTCRKQAIVPLMSQSFATLVGTDVPKVRCWPECAQEVSDQIEKHGLYNSRATNWERCGPAGRGKTWGSSRLSCPTLEQNCGSKGYHVANKLKVNN